MGNLYAESLLNPKSYDFAYHSKLGLLDSEYVDKVNHGYYSQSSFENDNIGFGLARWKDSRRKEGLYQECKNRIGDLNCQLGYIYKELTNPKFDYAY